MSKTTNDPKTYQQAAVPFATTEEADKAFTEFLEKVYALRNEYRIANVAILVKDSTEDTGVVMASAFYGNGLEQEAMYAYGYGQAVRDREQAMARLLGGKK